MLTLLLAFVAHAADHAPVRDVVVAREAELRACGEPGGPLQVQIRYPEDGAGTPAVQTEGQGVPPAVVSCVQGVLEGAPWPQGPVGNVFLTLTGGPGPFADTVILLGSLPKDRIDEVVKGEMSKIRYCYQQTLVQGKPSKKQPQGSVAVQFTIGAGGEVLGSKLSREEWTVPPADPSSFADCLLGRFQRMTFPPPHGGGIVIVRYPFVFSP